MNNGMIHFPNQTVRVVKEGAGGKRRIKEIDCDCVQVGRIIDSPIDQTVTVFLPGLGRFEIAKGDDYLGQTERTVTWIENRIKQKLNIRETIPDEGRERGGNRG